MKEMYWVLVDREPHPTNLATWTVWMAGNKGNNRTVCKTKVGDLVVSTVFLGMDHSYGAGPPLVFETMVFPEGRLIARYATWDDAMAGHMALVYQMRRATS